MKSRRTAFRLIGYPVIAALAMMMISVPRASAQDDVAAKLGDAIKFYGELEFEKGIDLVHQVLAQGNLTQRDSAASYATLSMLNYGLGADYLRKSYDYLNKIAGLGPCVIDLPLHLWPQQLRDHWYQILHENNQLVCDDNKDPKIKTVAVMSFDNYSVEKYRQELGYLAKGLADFFEMDFAQFSNLKVVERDKVDFILKELELSKSGMVLTSDAVRVGKLLGAQVMIFGTIMQTDKNEARMMVKAVNVETSEIIAYEEKEGKPDFFKMQKEMVKDLANKLDLIINDQTRSMLEETGTKSYDAASLYSQGLYHMEKYDYAKAYEYFKKAYEQDHNFKQAQEKMEIYRPLAS